MSSNWWENFFHGVTLDFWRAVISDELTSGEADFIAKHLQISPGAKLLDVPCGNGRLAIELGRRGYELTGVDIASEFIEEAKQKSLEAKVSVEWREHDMREQPWTAEFDGAFCFGNSFGYFDDKRNAEFLKAVSRSLKPGSRFILDYPAVAECMLPAFQPSRTMEIAGITVSIEHRYDHETAVMHNDFTFVHDGVTEQRPSSQRIYTYREVADLLSYAGFEVVNAYASLDKEAFRLGAHRLLLVSKTAQN